MTDAEFEEMLYDLFKHAVPPCREEFKEELLRRCLAVLDEQQNQEAREHEETLNGSEAYRELDDDEMDFLAAAGEPIIFKRNDNENF